MLSIVHTSMGFGMFEQLPKESLATKSKKKKKKKKSLQNSKSRMQVA
jgi:hypothetical protein